MFFYGKTDVGRRRSANQDNFIIHKYAQDVLYALVCDGMGGANGGDTASAVAVHAFAEVMDEAEKKNPSFFGLPGDEIVDILSKAVTEANRAVYKTAQDDPALEGMGTTLVGLLLLGQHVYAVNVGDSRLYLADASGVRQISHDHSVVQEWVDSGRITAEQAKTSRNRNIITRCVGTYKTVDPDFFEETAAPGSVFVLCSDGLTNHVDPEEIREIVCEASPWPDLPVMMSAESAARSCERLIDLANERGGTDNITAVVLSV